MYETLSQPRMLRDVSHFFLSDRPGGLLSGCVPGKEYSTAENLCISPVGIVIVDRSRIMRFANPVAEHMLGLKDEDIGQLFNFYIAVDEVSEVSIVRENRKPGIASMQIGQTEWRDECVYFAVIRDVTRSWRKKETER
nr:PAS domain-containing protein [Candidatus Desulfobia pelagia]